MDRIAGPQGLSIETEHPRGRSMTSRAHGSDESTRRINVCDSERLLSVGVGSGLAVYGLTRGSLAGLATAAIGGCIAYRGVTGHCELYHALGINTAESRGPLNSVRQGHGCRVEKTIVIDRSADELYWQWRRLDNLPKFMKHLESVTEAGDRSHWKVKTPLGLCVEWDAELISDRPGEVISWRSLDGSMVDTAGSVHFRPIGDGRSTEVRVNLKYEPPAGSVGAAAARWLGETPEEQIAEDLESFKQFAEGGSSQREAGREPAVVI